MRGKMIRPPAKAARVMKIEEFALQGGAKRHRLTLDCDHVVERAIRAAPPKLVYCPVCAG